jgi:hypothetical protein
LSYQFLIISSYQFGSFSSEVITGTILVEYEQQEIIIAQQGGSGKTTKQNKHVPRPALFGRVEEMVRNYHTRLACSQ